MKKIFILFCIFICSGCEYKDFPFSEMTYNGVYNIDKKGGRDVGDKFLEICKNLKCRLYNSSYRGGDEFMMIVRVNKNEELTLYKDSRDVVFFMITQKKRDGFNKLTLDILNEFKKKGVEFKLIHLEEWVCNEKELSYENCKRKDTEYDNLDYINFVKSNLS